MVVLVGVGRGGGQIRSYIESLSAAVDVVSGLLATAGCKSCSEAGWMPALQACALVHAG